MFSLLPQVNDPDMHHGTCVTHVPWCMPESLTSGFLWSRWRGKRSRHFRRMRNPQFYVSGRRPMGVAPGLMRWHRMTQELHPMSFEAPRRDHSISFCHTKERPCLSLRFSGTSWSGTVLRSSSSWHRHYTTENNTSCIIISFLTMKASVICIPFIVMPLLKSGDGWVIASHGLMWK